MEIRKEEKNLVKLSVIFDNPQERERESACVCVAAKRNGESVTNLLASFLRIKAARIYISTMPTS